LLFNKNEALITNSDTHLLYLHPLLRAGVESMKQAGQALAVGLKVKFKKKSGNYSGVIIEVSPMQTFAIVKDLSGNKWAVSMDEILI
jgi:hypothetical protein